MFFIAAIVATIAIAMVVANELFLDTQFVRPVLVLMLGITALPSFVFLAILGAMPWLMRLQYQNLLTEKEKQAFASVKFFMIED